MPERFRTLAVKSKFRGLAGLLLCSILIVPPSLASQATLPDQRDATPRAAPSATSPTSRRELQRPSARLDQSDEIAALQAIEVALSTVADGSTYVWQRGHGLLNGLIRPTASFKDQTGEVCRHVIIMLNSQHFTRQIEGIACRDGLGVWTLSG